MNTPSLEIVGLNRSTVYTWRVTDLEFAQAWADAEEQMLDLLKERVHGRARETSAALAMFLLKRRRPEKDGDQRRTIVSQHNATVNVSAPSSDSTSCRMKD